MHKLPEILDHLTRRGHRLTRPRRAVIASLVDAGGATSVRELHTATDAVNLVTVYRTLHWLVDLGVARQVDGGPGGERYELLDGAHTHHLHCDACGRMFTVPVCGVAPSVFAVVEREYAFLVADHRLTFHGTCGDCRKT